MSTFQYGFQQGIGIEPYLLKGIDKLTGTENDPHLKIDNLGFLNLLQSQKKTLELLRAGGNGAIQFITAKYMQRLVEGQTSQSDTCSTANVTPYQEVQVPLNIYSQIAFYIEDALIQEYTTDLNQETSIGLPPTKAMVAMIDQIKAGANAIMTNINRQLMNQIVFGTNPSTGSNAASTINFPLNTTNLPLESGLNEIFAQAQIAEFATGNLQIFGNGLFHRFMLNQPAKTYDQSGLMTKVQAMGVDFYYDQLSTSILGANEIVVVSPDSIQLVEYPRYTGSSAGRKGLSDFGTFVLPMQITPNQVLPVAFDFQLRFLDCPDQVAGVNDYYGNPISGYRGWQMIVSKTCGLFQNPTNAYKAGDFLSGTNGTLRYNITNV